jgi:hypothetical protein
MSAADWQLPVVVSLEAVLLEPEVSLGVSVTF